MRPVARSSAMTLVSPGEPRLQLGDMTSIRLSWHNDAVGVTDSPTATITTDGLTTINSPPSPHDTLPATHRKYAPSVEKDTAKARIDRRIAAKPLRRGALPTPPVPHRHS